MAVIPLTIGGINEAKAQLADLKKSIEEAGSTKEKGALTKQFKTLEKQVGSTTKAFNTMSKSGANLTATFEDIYGEGAKPLTNQISELEDRLYSMSLAGEGASEEFKQISQQVGKLKGTIIDVDKSIDLLAENRGLSVFSTGLGQVGERLLRLDFDGAAKDAKQMNDAVGNLGSIGKKALTGFAKTVGHLSKAFIKMGIALLANPIFLIVAVIVAIVGVIAMLLSKLGLLKPMLDAIGTAFGYIKDAIMLVVQAIKDFLDWIGLTSFAQKELAQENIDMIDSMIAKADEKSKAFAKNIDHEIRIAGIQGENTTKLQKKKQEELIKEARLRKKLLEERIRQAEIIGDIDEEELAKIKEQIEATKEVIDTARKEYAAINLQADVDTENRRQADYDKWKTLQEKKLADEKTYGLERLRIQRQIEDMSTRQIEDGLLKELISNNAKYDRLIEDTLSNEKILEEEKNALIAGFEAEKEAKNEELREKDIEAKEKAKQIELDFILELNEAIENAQDEADTKAFERQEAIDAKILSDAKALTDGKLFLAESLQQGLQGIETLIASTGAETVGLQKTIALAQIAIDTAKSISAVVAGATSAAATTGPAAPFVLAGYIATGIATVSSSIAGAYKALQSAPPIGGSAGGGAVPSVSTTSTQSATPSFELFGQSNDSNTFGSPQDQETNQEIIVKAYVSETEVTATQNTIQQIQENATL